MKTATFQHANGHAVTVFIDQVAAIQMGGNKGVLSEGCLIQFASGWSIPVIEHRLDVLKAFEEAEAQVPPPSGYNPETMS